MKKIKMLMAFVAILVSGNVLAQTITTNDVEIKPGETSTLTVSLQTTIQSGVVEFYLTLPEGITIDKDEEGYIASPGNLLTRTSMIDVKLMDDGSYRFECIPPTSRGNMQTSSGDYSGSIVSITLKAGSEMETAALHGSVTKITAVKPGGGDTNTSIGDIADFTFNIYVPDKKTAGISKITADKLAKEGAVYTILGQRVSSVSNSGLYIINGKKVVVK